MRTLALFLLLVGRSFVFATGDTNIIAISDWSKPVGTDNGHVLRARMIISYGRGPAFAGPHPETQVHLEFQNVSGAIARPTQFYFDPEKGFHCELRDAKGNLVGPGGVGSGGGAGSSWITLPYDSTIRLRANMYGYGNEPGRGLNLTIYPTRNQWEIRPGDTNTYYLSGTFVVTTPTNSVPSDPEAARAVWTGTLKLSRMRVYGPK
jgi:hypothetical protein